MNDNHFDQFLQRLNYLSRWTLASSYSYRMGSPLLPITSAYSHSMRPKFTIQKSYKSKKTERQRQISLEADESNRVADNFILIEQLDRQFNGQEEEQQLIQYQDSPFQIIRQNSSSQIRIEQDSQQSCQSYEEYAANQQLDQPPKEKIHLQSSALTEFYESQRSNQERQRQSGFPVIKTGAKQIVIQDSDEFQQENQPTMSRNYTFGYSLDAIKQINNVQKTKQLFANLQEQPAVHQKAESFQEEENLQRKTPLQLLLDDSYNEIQEFSQITSPKFCMTVINQQQGTAVNQNLSLKGHGGHGDLNTVKKVKRTPQKSYETTSPKKSAGSAKKIDKNIKSHPYKKIFQQPKARIQLSIRPKEVIKKVQPYSNSIDKIKKIMSFLPKNLQKSYESIKQHLDERQHSIDRQIKDQQKQIKVLQMLVYIEKMGLNIDTYLLCHRNQKQQQVILNQIKLRLAIRQIIKKNSLS